MSAQQKTCIFILGMHRSGTSALTGVLSMLGVELGSDLMQPWADNPKGFFENNKIWQFDQHILESFDSSWDDPFLCGHDWCSKRDLLQFEEHIEGLVNEEFSGTNVFAIKDPRMCILFPFWKAVLARQGIRSVCVLPFRHPLEVAGSLTRRNGFSTEKGLLLWMNYVLSAERVSRGCKRVFLNFADLFTDGRKILHTVSAELDVTFPLSYAEVEGRIADFLDRKLKHHDLLPMGASLMEQKVDKVYNLYCRAARGKAGSSWEEELQRLADEYQAMYSFFLNGDVRKMADCPGRLQTAEEQIAEFQQTVDALRHKVGNLEQDTKTVRAEKQALAEEIKTMRDTKAWRAAEFFRRQAARLKQSGRI